MIQTEEAEMDDPMDRNASTSRKRSRFVFLEYPKIGSNGMVTLSNLCARYLI